MDAKDIRAKFFEFAGNEKFDKFMTALNTTCQDKGRLLYWQEQLWEEFLKANDLKLDTSFVYIENLFNTEAQQLPDGGENIDQWKKEHQVWVCRECDKTFREKFDVCPKCSTKKSPVLGYRRLFIERVTFIPILMVIIFFLSFLSSAPDARMLPIIVPAFYILAHQFMGIKFIEIFPAGTVPSYAKLIFSWKLFLKEGLVFAGIIVAFGIAFAVVELWRWSRAT